MSHHNTQKKDISQQNQVFLVEKQKGETLAMLLERFRVENPSYAKEKITYAGRLDPMASGIVPLLIGEARFEKETWNHKKKTYEVEILLGIETDTLDMLGLVTKICIERVKKAKIESALEAMKLITSLPYPMYSSRPVDGVPLFTHARRGTKAVPPLKQVTIYSVECRGVYERKISELLEETIPIIEKVEGDFRQTEILKGWGDIKNIYAEQSVQIISLRITASSGTYMRSLAQWLGTQFSVPALAYSIHRMSIKK